MAKLIRHCGSRLLRADQVAEHEIYHDDIVCEYPQSGEVIRNRSNLQALRSHHPGRPSGFFGPPDRGKGRSAESQLITRPKASASTP